jgi:pimeloyl-ACP methyl ester carboxylesterase
MTVGYAALKRHRQKYRVPPPQYTGAMAAFRSMLTAVALTGVAAAQQGVSFPTQDGGLIYGDMYGKGARAVVLAHGGRFNKESWEKQARALAAAGFRALTIDFRGEGQSRGGIEGRPFDEGRPLDVLGAIHYLRKTGAKSVGVVGASMGGDYAAEAAETEPSEIDRLVLLASGAYTPLTRMKGRKLFIVARDDANADGPRLPKIRAQYEKAINPKGLIILDGSAHAQFLFQTDQGERVMREILQFLLAR